MLDLFDLPFYFELDDIFMEKDKVNGKFYNPTFSLILVTKQ